ncbi:MAG: hypothetical protein VX966_10715 [Chloroflexota bacterium]|nr:hypothetical protein [Chloroflexota bacterium]
MEILDWILLVIRWTHALGAVAWIGGSIFYMFVIRPVFVNFEDLEKVGRSVATEFQSIVKTAIAILIITGIILTVSRLTVEPISTVYVVVLIIKVTVAIYMFYLVWLLKRRQLCNYPPSYGMGRKLKTVMTSSYTVLFLGVLVFGLADLLTMIVETNLR